MSQLKVACRRAGYTAFGVGLIQFMLGGSGLTFLHDMQGLIPPGFLLILAASGVAFVFFGWQLKNGKRRKRALKVMLPLAAIPAFISLIGGAFFSLAFYGVLTALLVYAWRALPGDTESNVTESNATDPDPVVDEQRPDAELTPKKSSSSETESRSSSPPVTPYRRAEKENDQVSDEKQSTEKKSTDKQLTEDSKTETTVDKNEDGGSNSPSKIPIHFSTWIAVGVLSGFVLLMIAFSITADSSGPTYAEYPETSYNEGSEVQPPISENQGEQAYRKGQEAYRAGDFEHAYHNYSSAAEAGNASAMLELGWMFQHGQFVQQSYERAAEWYQKAVNAGLKKSAGYLLANLYRNGNGVAMDLEKAFDLYLDSAMEVFPPAMFEVAEMYRLGNGVDRNQNESLGWYRHSARLGYEEAQTMLGHFYMNGNNGVEQSFTEAETWYRRAANEDHPRAQFQMGVLYQNGYAVERNRVRAAMWYQIASSNGYEEAGSRLQQLRSALSTSQWDRAKQLATEWSSEPVANNHSGQRQHVLPDVIGISPDSIEANWGPADTQSTTTIEGIGDVEVWSYNRVPVPPGEEHTLRVVSFYLHADSVAGATEMLVPKEDGDMVQRMLNRQEHVKEILGEPDLATGPVHSWRGGFRPLMMEDYLDGVTHDDITTWRDHPNRIGYNIIQTRTDAGLDLPPEQLPTTILIGNYHFTIWAEYIYSHGHINE